MDTLVKWLQWLKQSSDEIKEQIFKLAKKGLYPSQIGEFALYKAAYEFNVNELLVYREKQGHVWSCLL